MAGDRRPASPQESGGGGVLKGIAGTAYLEMSGYESGSANLHVASSAPGRELFVQLIDRAPDGSLLYLNRGMLRGSHRAVDADAPSRLMLPIVPRDQVQGFQAPEGPCAYASMRCVKGG